MKKSVHRQFVRHLRLKAQAKALYDKSDAAFAKAFQNAKVGDTVTLETGETFEIVDNYANTNIGWGHGSVRRFELKKKKAA